MKKGEHLLCSRYLTTKEPKELWINRLQSSRHLFSLIWVCCRCGKCQGPKACGPYTTLLEFYFLYLWGEHTLQNTHGNQRTTLGHALSCHLYLDRFQGSNSGHPHLTCLLPTKAYMHNGIPTALCVFPLLKQHVCFGSLWQSQA